MKADAGSPVLELSRSRFRKIAEDLGLLSASVAVLAKPLTPAEAIGEPGRRDFPISLGKERIVESRIFGWRGHAFTDSPREFLGTIEDVLALDLGNSQNRAVYVSTLNAALASLNMVSATVHCRDDEPGKCAREIARHLLERHGQVSIGLIGLNPAIAESLIEVFGPARVGISDLNRANIGTKRFGVEIQDGWTRTGALVKDSEVLLITGTTLTNGTFDSVWSRIQEACKTGLVYGVTAAGVSRLIGFERICPYGRIGRDISPNQETE